MDFLTFKKFISIEVLILFYYLGALIFPVVGWFLFFWLIRKYQLLYTIGSKGKKIVWGLLSKKKKIMLLALFVSLFLFMQLIWRMMFEFLIAYIQIRNALLYSQL
jgi:hypothetical protein